MQVKTETVAGWSTQAGAAKRHFINTARSYLAKQRMYGIPAPDTMEIPDSVMESHSRRYRLAMADFQVKEGN